MTSTLEVVRACDAYVDYIENLNAQNISELGKLAVPEVQFRDPFNDVVGLDKFIAVLRDMFENVEDAKFTVSQRACSDDCCFIKWRFSGKVRFLGDWQFDGLSEVRFADDGRILAHTDYWDASVEFYMRLPVIGWVFRLLRRRLQVT